TPQLLAVGPDPFDVALLVGPSVESDHDHRLVADGHEAVVVACRQQDAVPGGQGSLVVVAIANDDVPLDHAEDVVLTGMHVDVGLALRGEGHPGHPDVLRLGEERAITMPGLVERRPKGEELRLGGIFVRDLRILTHGLPSAPRPADRPQAGVAMSWSLGAW